MPIFWTEEREGQGGARLPYTEIRVGSLTLGFAGRFGPRLREAVQALEAKQSEVNHGNDTAAAGAEGS